ncbi:MAG: flagellar hook-basal body protein [Oscillospiraceae bacterium]|nr:flagellar hook-basal body protein [Oscillospiraceae bacterium]
MLRSLYTAATAMLTDTRRMDVISNNLTNAETRGFRADTLVSQSFRDMLISRLNDPNINVYAAVGPHNTGIHIDRVYTSFVQGPLEETRLSTDLALAGDGFFAVETPDGERYTRNGSFSVDADGYLVTPAGQYVLGQNGRLRVGSGDFSVTTEGVVTVGGAQTDRLRVVSFADNDLLRKDRDSLMFNLEPGTNPPALSSAEVRQGTLEGANVDTARELVDMMQVYRHYELNQRVLRMVDESLGRAVNDIARV